MSEGGSDLFRVREAMHLMHVQMKEEIKNDKEK